MVELVHDVPKPSALEIIMGAAVTDQSKPSVPRPQQAAVQELGNIVTDGAGNVFSSGSLPGRHMDLTDEFVLL